MRVPHGCLHFLSTRTPLLNTIAGIIRSHLYPIFLRYGHPFGTLGVSHDAIHLSLLTQPIGGIFAFRTRKRHLSLGLRGKGLRMLENAPDKILLCWRNRIQISSKIDGNIQE